MNKLISLASIGLGVGIGIGYNSSKVSLEQPMVTKEMLEKWEKDYQLVKKRRESYEPLPHFVGQKHHQKHHHQKHHHQKHHHHCHHKRHHHQKECTPEQLRALTKEIVSWKENNCVPGVSVCVMVKDKVVFNKGFGYSDIENAVPMTSNTKLRIASISKALTSSGLGLLMEQGKVSLDDSIYKYVPEFPKHPKFTEHDITVRQIASHLGGIRHYKKGSESEHFSTIQYKSAKDPTNALKEEKRPFPTPLESFINSPWHEHEPGAKFFYSTFSFTLLGTVIENVSGVDYASFMKSNVFDKIGMKNTVVDQHNTVVPNRTRQYNLKASGSTFQLVNCEYANPSYKYAGGGFLSTAKDICKFGSAMISGRILKPETIKQLFKPQITRDGQPVEYGLGWMIKNNYIYHTGNAVGGSTVLVMLPDESIVVCVLANQQDTNLINEFGFKLANVFSKTN